MELLMSVPHVVTISVGKLRPNKRNARTHSKKQIRQIANSILRFGWTYPILADENLEIIAGFGRRNAAEHLGLQDVPVIIMAGLSDVEKRALALADNKIAANAGWDRTVLAAELGDLADLLPKCDLNIDITGFEPAEIDGLIGNLIDPEQDPADELPAIGSTPVARATCGSFLGIACCVETPDQCETAAMLFTDPPISTSILGRGHS
jgi:ParB-like chromosome segregation protein Spo0J